jgi:hypothetical protein
VPAHPFVVSGVLRVFESYGPLAISTFSSIGFTLILQKFGRIIETVEPVEEKK